MTSPQPLRDLPLSLRRRGEKYKNTMLIHNNQILKDRRRNLRKKSTKPEEILWWYLRDKKLGVKFKRQHSIGGYILDFYSSEKKLIIELDGQVHKTKEAQEYDTVRDKYFKELGYKTIRFWNKEVENEIEKVVETIKQVIYKI